MNLQRLTAVANETKWKSKDDADNDIENENENEDDDDDDSRQPKTIFLNESTKKWNTNSRFVFFIVRRSNFSTFLSVL